jgi:hypothetical protein
MRLRNSRKSNPSPEPQLATIAGDADVDVKATDPVSAPIAAPAPWRVEQLHALGPVTGPNHRTAVPIVRRDTSPGDHVDVVPSRTEISFVSEGMESWIGRDSY